MKVIEKFVCQKNLAEVYAVIEAELEKNICTQVFIEKNIYQEMKYYGYSSHVFRKNIRTSNHYTDVAEEVWFVLTEDNYFSDSIAEASFIYNCKGYMQLIQFSGKKLKGYVHHYQGFEQLLLIHFSD